MKNTTIYLLSLLLFVWSFIPRSNLNELSKLPFLVKHYQSHVNSSNENASLLNFLNEHYSNKDHDDKNHEKLPLQDQSLTFFSLIFSPNSNLEIELNNQKSIQPVSFYKVSYSYLFLSDLFHPPKEIS